MTTSRSSILSQIPIIAANNIDVIITTTVELTSSTQVGHVTFFSSARTSNKNVQSLFILVSAKSDRLTERPFTYFAPGLAGLF
jgi:hypothetical protein